MVTNQKPAPPSSAPPVAQGDPRSMRRSSRLTIDIPVEIICKNTQSNKMHTEETRTMVVSAHGCALGLKTGVLPGDKVVLIHKLSRQESNCRVVMCRSSKTGWDVGLEFVEPSPKFWHIAFPPDDWDPSFRESQPPAKAVR